MIRNFIASWPLFHDAYVTGWLMAVQLSLVGILVVARDQIFVGAAVSHASMLGITAAVWVGGLGAFEFCGWCRSDPFLSLCGSVAAALGAMLTARRLTVGGESREAVTGWVFLFGISGSILLASGNPVGLEEVHRLLASTIIGAGPGDVVAFGVMTTITVLAFAFWRRTILLLAMDPEMARAVGVRADLWNAALWVWLGVAVGNSIRVAGMTYVFGCLVLPALAARNLCREARQMLVVAPLLALASGVVGFMVADQYDFPPGQTTTALQCLLLALAWGLRRLATEGMLPTLRRPV